MALETNEKFCPICGKPVTDPTFNRFGEWACSEAHADDYVREVRAKRERMAASAAGQQGGRHEHNQPRSSWFGGRRGCC